MSGYVIYKICCDDCEYVYVGSTTNFTKRKSRHKINCYNENGKHHNIKLYTTIRDNGGWDNWRMVIIDELGDVSKRQAEIQEEKWRVELQANLNMKKCYTTEEEKKEQSKAHNKKYYEENKDKLLEQQKKYNEQNRDKRNEYRKQHYEQNKDKILECNKQNKDKIAEYQKQHYEQNKDKILEYQKKYNEENRDKRNEKITCECGCEIIKRTLARHKKTTKHQAWEWRQTIQS